jgi:uroporphyrin-III C-methyltransferase/precorrin-2 dehydrogenase/sirohydrochlorin ferrochelatase
MRYYPAFLDLVGRSCLVVGGGETALAKLRLLRKAGARVTLVAPRALPEIEALAEAGEIERIRRGFVAGDVAGRALVQGASGIAEVDRRVSEAARDAGLPVNVVDRTGLSSFITPAIVERDPLVIGISTAGTAPVLARQLRARIEALLPAHLGRLARFAEGFRGAVRATIGEPAERRRFWERFFAGPLAARVLAGEEGGAREAMLALINRQAPAEDGRGSVAIVGAGPGDPELLTLKALRALQDADVVVYDRLVAPEILDLARRDARRLYVGKAKARHSRTQDQINAMLLAEARAGRRVVRLKGGDPFVFGRGGEERAYLLRHGVDVRVVPGITAATGCAAAAGIPLTHRAVAQAVTFLTGHGAAGEPDLDWAGLAARRETLVIYMGVSTAGTIARRLIEHGLAGSTPVAVVENGTLASQRVIAGRLDGLGALIERQAVTGPALIVVGEVAATAESAGSLAPLLADCA